MKLWDKGKNVDVNILEFTIGKDRELDIQLATSDIIASIAHVIMLESVNLLNDEEKNKLVGELIKLYDLTLSGQFRIEQEYEDIHSKIEKILTDQLGFVGEKLHTARSRNDQVLVDLKLFYRKQTAIIARSAKNLIIELIEKGIANIHNYMPGYTHFQVAMPSSFGLWFGAYAESLVEDLLLHTGILSYLNQNPLGSAAGYGTSFPINREKTTQLLEFENLHINSINAQFSRGKTEKYVMMGMSSIAASLSKMAMDITLFMSQNFGFLNLKDEFTTGSSIMPHKKNPDVLEIIRAKCNRIISGYNEVTLLIQNLPTGYHRDFQLLKEITFRAYEDMYQCLEMMLYVVKNLEIKDDILEDNRYNYIFSVENINEKIKKGISFREAYKQVAKEIDSGQFKPKKNISYTHTGSIGNPSFDKIMSKFNLVWRKLKIEKLHSFEKRFINKVKADLK